MARLQVVGEVLALFYSGWNLEPPSKEERQRLSMTWATALKNIPVEQILPIAEEVLSEHESSFMPVPAHLIQRWNASRSMTPEGAVNADAYQPFRPSKVPALPAPLPPLQIDPAELKQRLGTPVRSPKPIFATDESPSSVAPATPVRAPLSQRWSDELLEVARVGNIDLERCTPLQLAELRSFAKWWLDQHPGDNMDEWGFLPAYREFCAAKTQGETS